MLLDKDDFHDFFKKFQCDGVPRYMVINKTGRFVGNDAQRPSDDLLPADVDTLLLAK